MRINLKDIYAKMENWYAALITSDGKDTSYNELYSSLFILYSADLISSDTWDKIKMYDTKLFSKYN